MHAFSPLPASPIYRFHLYSGPRETTRSLAVWGLSHAHLLLPPVSAGTETFCSLSPGAGCYVPLSGLQMMEFLMFKSWPGSPSMPPSLRMSYFSVPQKENAIGPKLCSLCSEPNKQFAFRFPFPNERSK